MVGSQGSEREEEAHPSNEGYFALIRPSAWKTNYANYFAYRGFSAVRINPGPTPMSVPSPDRLPSGIT